MLPFEPSRLPAVEHLLIVAVVEEAASAIA
jgi:hypothetical protein